uniref:Uncharacterized protein n=1 Tax=Tetradesmus obliquus TaxID=3088 RepID=A0A383W2D6_TETOB
MQTVQQLLLTTVNAGQAITFTRRTPSGSAGSCSKLLQQPKSSSTKLRGSCGRLSSKSQLVQRSKEAAVLLKLLGISSSASQATQPSCCSVVGSSGSVRSWLQRVNPSSSSFDGKDGRTSS